MKIKIHSMYDFKSFTGNRIPEYIEWSKTEGEFNCYVDSHVRDVIEDNSIALLIEPRSIQPQIYRFIEEGGHKLFKYIFTHDSKLLSIFDNTKLILFGGVYEYNVMPKIKDISMVSSNKKICELHIKRTKLAEYLKINKMVDTFGTFDGGNFVSTSDIYGPYKFSVVIENYIDDYWFTEKICNAFANKTIPIYYGAKRIGNYFNTHGMIQAEYIEDIPEIIKQLDVNKFYTERAYAVDENYALVKRFECFEDWFWLEYKNLLEGMINE